MTDFILSLFNPDSGARFDFADNEVPENIAYGGTQKLAVHELVGGGRVVDALGAQPRDLEWSGWFLGAGAFERARQLDALRHAGVALELSLYHLRYRVFIASFTADFQRHYKIPYSVSLTVAQDRQYPDSAALPDSAQQIAADEAWLKSLVVAVGQQTKDGLPAQSALVQQKASVMQRVLAGFGRASDSVSRFAQMTSSDISKILTPVHDVRQASLQLLAQVENLAQNVTTLGGIAPHNRAAQNVARLSSSINTLNASASLVQLDSVLGRLGNNVAAEPAASKTVTVSGGDLHTVALEQYGSATAWTTIARANGLSDPQIMGTVTLKIPPVPDNDGGVLNG
jgi:hypothetical protein